jgi:HSP20 family molecular chaperone IbpA
MLLLRRGRGLGAVIATGDIGEPFELQTVRKGRLDPYATWRPPTEVFECGEELVVRVEIAGLAPGMLDVSVSGDELHVRGDRAAPHPKGPRVYHESHIRYGCFDTRVVLPFPVDTGTASAEYVDGVLSVRLPRRAAVKVPMRSETPAAACNRGEL